MSNLISKRNHNSQEIIIFGTIFSYEALSQSLLSSSNQQKGSKVETDCYCQNKHLLYTFEDIQC